MVFFAKICPTFSHFVIHIQWYAIFYAISKHFLLILHCLFCYNAM